MPVNDAETIFILSGRPGPYQALRLPDKGDVTKTHVLWHGERNKKQGGTTEGQEERLAG